MPRVALIVNPRATRVTPSRTLAVREALTAAGLAVEVQETEYRGHAASLAAAAAGEVDAILVYSGDGTYNEAINGVTTRVPFGFVPGGGASVFPRALGLPADPSRAASRIAQALHGGRARSITLGRINGRRFCFSAGIGFDAEVVRRVELRGRDRYGRRKGATAFAASALRVLAESRFRIEPQLEVEGYGVAALLVVINGHPYTYAGRLPVQLLRGADFAAGLDFVAPRAITPASVAGLGLGLFRGTLAHDRRVHSGHDLDAFRVVCSRPLPVQADGEDLGDLSEIAFTSERDALLVLC